MFTEIQKICAELSAEIAAKGYKTAEISVVVKATGVTWLYRASPRAYDFDTKFAETVDQLRELVLALPDVNDWEKSDIKSAYNALLARAAAVGVELPR